MNAIPATLANWRIAPHNRRAFHHVRELIPTADIANDPRAIRELPVSLQDLHVKVEPDSGEPLTLAQFLAETQTDGFVVLHRARLVAEHYGNGMGPDDPHILMSVSKSMLGLLIGLPIKYRSKWYVLEGKAPLVFGVGIHGQNLFVGRANPLVIAKLSSQAMPLDPARIALTLRAVSEIRKVLA